MTTIKWMISIFAASAISSYATFHIIQPNQNELDAAPSIENSRQLNAANINVTEQHQELAKTKNTTGSTGGNCEKNPNQTARLTANTDANNINQAQPARTEDLQFTYEQKQHEIAAVREFFERTGDSSVSVISDNYDSEPVDPQWARSKEDELLALLDSSETLQNTAPLELSCKSQNCRLVLSAHDENQGEFLYSAFKNEALQGSDENKKQIVSYFSNPDSGEIHIYLSKSAFSTLLDREMD